MSNVNSFPTETEVVEINGKVGVAQKGAGSDGLVLKQVN